MSAETEPPIISPETEAKPQFKDSVEEACYNELTKAKSDTMEKVANNPDLARFNMEDYKKEKYIEECGLAAEFEKAVDLAAFVNFIPENMLRGVDRKAVMDAVASAMINNKNRIDNNVKVRNSSNSKAFL